MKIASLFFISFCFSLHFQFLGNLYSFLAQQFQISLFWSVVDIRMAYIICDTAYYYIICFVAFCNKIEWFCSASTDYIFCCFLKIYVMRISFSRISVCFVWSMNFEMCVLCVCEDFPIGIGCDCALAYSSHSKSTKCKEGHMFL